MNNKLHLENSEEYKVSSTNIKFSHSKMEQDLYHEESDVSYPIIRVKRTMSNNNEEKWKITLDNKVIFVIEGVKLNNKEKEFLRSIPGINFLINQGKNGVGSFSAFRADLKNIMNA